MAERLSSLFDLSGRVAIVTGGSRGLGAECAEGLAEGGASLVLCARRDEWLTPAIESLRARGFPAEGLRCEVTNLDVRQDDGGPRTGKITVVLSDDEGRFVPDEPLTPIHPLPSRYLNGPPPPRQRHLTKRPGMSKSWPHALWLLGVWAAFSGLIIGGLSGLVWLLLHVLS